MIAKRGRCTTGTLKRLAGLLAVAAMLATTPAAAQTSSLQARAPGALYTVKDTSDQPLVDILMLGQIARPGAYRIPDGTSLLDAIAYAGGIQQNGSGAIRVTRSAANQTFKFEELPLSQPYPIHAGDVVFAEESWTVDAQAYLGIASIAISLLTMGIVIWAI